VGDHFSRRCATRAKFEEASLQKSAEPAQLSKIPDGRVALDKR
jgi:hypothetical protein